MGRPQSPRPNPIKNRLHGPPRHSESPKFRLSVHIQNHCTLGASVLRIRRPRTQQHSATANDPPRSVRSQPMTIRTIVQSPCQHRLSSRDHPSKFVSRPLPHIAKHRPPMMQNNRHFAPRRFSNCEIARHACSDCRQKHYTKDTLRLRSGQAPVHEGISSIRETLVNLCAGGGEHLPRRTGRCSGDVPHRSQNVQ